MGGRLPDSCAEVMRPLTSQISEKKSEADREGRKKERLEREVRLMGSSPVGNGHYATAWSAPSDGTHHVQHPFSSSLHRHQQQSI